MVSLGRDHYDTVRAVVARPSHIRLTLLMIATNIWFWVGFIAFVLAMLALDLGVFNRRPHVVGAKEASVWTAVWVGLALLFAGGLLLFESHHSAMTFLTGYLIEE